MKLLRNHTSLALWVGGNEQFPPEDINQTLKEELSLHPAFRAKNSSSDMRWTSLSKEIHHQSIHTLQEMKVTYFKHVRVVARRDSEVADPSLCLDGTRLYIQGSLWEGFAKGNGDFTDGPYGIQNPEDFFKDDFYAYAFNPEIGSVGVPVSATMRMTMASEALDPPRLERLPDGYTVEHPNLTWDYHKYIPYADANKKVQDQIALYGEPTGIEDFCEQVFLPNVPTCFVLVILSTRKLFIMSFAVPPLEQPNMHLNYQCFGRRSWRITSSIELSLRAGILGCGRNILESCYGKLKIPGQV